jgi:hypothetical protein
MSDTPDLQYPIGNYTPLDSHTLEQVHALGVQIAEQAAKVRQAVAGLSEAQQDTPYREGGWTVRQVVHHMFDSHANGFIRLKLALTEDKPTIKPYLEAEFAKLPDSSLPTEVSLSLLDGLHLRWSHLISHLKTEDLERGYMHPEYQKFYSLGQFVGLYAWHGAHHTAHILELRKREGWV